MLMPQTSVSWFHTKHLQAVWDFEIQILFFCLLSRSFCAILWPIQSSGGGWRKPSGPKGPFLFTRVFCHRPFLLSGRICLSVFQSLLWQRAVAPFPIINIKTNMLISKKTIGTSILWTLLKKDYLTYVYISVNIMLISLLKLCW